MVSEIGLALKLYNSSKIKIKNKEKLILIVITKQLQL